MKKYILLILLVFLAAACVQEIPSDRNQEKLSSPPSYLTDGFGFSFTPEIPELQPAEKSIDCTKKETSFLTKISYYLIKPVKQQIQAISVQIFYNIVRDGSPYSRIIKIILILYVSIYGIMFISNMVQINATDIVSRLFKVSVVLVLMTPTAYTFFNEYLFELFTDGAENLLKVVSDPYCSGSSSDHIQFFAFIDHMINDFIDDNNSLILRISALLISFPIGWVCFYILIVCMARYFFAILKAMLAYMFAFTAIGFLISMGPIFIVLILFEQTREFFNNWLKMLMMFALQPVVMFASIFIVSIFIADTIYSVFPALKWAQFAKITWDTPPIKLDLFYVSWYVPKWWCTLSQLMSGSSAFCTGESLKGIGQAFIQYLANLGILYILTDILGKIPAFVEEMASRLTSSLGTGVGVQDPSANSIYDKIGSFAKPEDKKKK